MHHSVADGIAGVASVGALLDNSVDMPCGAAEVWTPEPQPSVGALLADNIRRHAELLARGAAALARPDVLQQRLRTVRSAVREVVALAGAPATPHTSLDRAVGPHRTLTVIRSSLDLIKHIGRSRGATVNDVLLAVSAGGIRGLLASRGELVGDLTLPVAVPVALRPAPDRSRARGNRVGQMIVPLPIGPADPGARLSRITAETTGQKAGRQAGLGPMFGGRLARRALAMFLARHPVSVTIANVPGPPSPLYWAGAVLLEMFPIVPLIGNVPLGIGAMSYAGQFTITAVADQDAIPDISVFAASLEDDLRELAARVCTEPAPPGVISA